MSHLILTFLLSGLLVSSKMSFQRMQFSRLSLLFQSLFGRASDSHLAEAFLLCFTHLLLLLLPTHTSYQYPSPVACLSSCGECSYGGFISIQIAELSPLHGFAHQLHLICRLLLLHILAPRINLSLRLITWSTLFQKLNPTRNLKKSIVKFHNSKESEGLAQFF